MNQGKRALPGVSCIICCHNSSSRLQQTLSHLAKQTITDDFAWEVILVDNASTDDTVKLAKKVWSAISEVPLRVVSEPQVGLSNARVSGINEARYEYLSFVDDDNWVHHDWIQTVKNIFQAHPKVGACGGLIESATEISPPPWFHAHKEHYAVGPQGKVPGDISNTRGWLCGAGFNLRSSAWQVLRENGFRFALTGRKGDQLTSGEDVELCYALRLAGWKLWYEPGLKLTHFIPKERLTWSYLRQSARGRGRAGLSYDAYGFETAFPQNRKPGKVERSWQWQSLRAAKGLLSYGFKPARAITSPLEGDREVLAIEALFGRLTKLLQLRGQYEAKYDEVETLVARFTAASLTSTSKTS